LITLSELYEVESGSKFDFGRRATKMFGNDSSPHLKMFGEVSKPLIPEMSDISGPKFRFSLSMPILSLL